jgi:hypothetical protein
MSKQYAAATQGKRYITLIKGSRRWSALWSAVGSTRSRSVVCGARRPAPRDTRSAGRRAPTAPGHRAETPTCTGVLDLARHPPPPLPGAGSSSHHHHPCSCRPGSWVLPPLPSGARCAPPGPGRGGGGGGGGGRGQNAFDFVNPWALLGPWHKPEGALALGAYSPAVAFESVCTTGRVQLVAWPGGESSLDSEQLATFASAYLGLLPPVLQPLVGGPIRALRADGRGWREPGPLDCRATDLMVACFTGDANSMPRCGSFRDRLRAKLTSVRE